MDGLPRLCVLIGASRLPSTNPTHSDATLILEAEADRAEALQQDLARGGGSDGDVVIVQAVLVANPGDDSPWFRYNDSRLNGPVNPERWQPLYPNAQLLQHDTCRGQTLAQLLEAWPAAAGGGGISLTISQGDPLAALAGAGPWLARLQRIELQGPRAATLWHEPVDTLLREQGFRAVPDQPLCWIPDPLATRLIQQQSQLEEASNRQELLLTALRHLFPYASYRAKRPDLADLTDLDLVDHFVFTGLREGVDLRFAAIHNELEQLQGQRAEDGARIALLDRQTERTAQQLDLLKELVARSIVDP